MALLAARYDATEWFFLHNVRNAAGFNASRTADAVAMNLWPSRGLELHGFEVKVTRGDWLKELANPAKAEAVFGYCDRWWLVAAARDVVLPAELPPTWGLLVPRGGGLVAEVEAPKLAATPLDRSIIAAMLKRARTGMVSEASIDARLQQAEKRGAERCRSEKERAKGELAEFKESVRAFTSASGIQINAWNGPQLGRALQFVLNHGVDRFRQDLEQRRRWAEGVVSECDVALANLPPQEPE